jgi:hypothetical protein
MFSSYLEWTKMDKVHKSSDSECYTVVKYTVVVSYLFVFIHQPVSSVTFQFITHPYNKRLTESICLSFTKHWDRPNIKQFIYIVVSMVTMRTPNSACYYDCYLQQSFMELGLN